MMQYDDDYIDEYDDDEEGEEYDDTYVTLACEDCDYRWKVPIDFEDESGGYEDAICPMCGSSNVVEI